MTKFITLVTLHKREICLVFASRIRIGFHRSFHLVARLGLDVLSVRISESDGSLKLGLDPRWELVLVSMCCCLVGGITTARIFDSNTQSGARMNLSGQCQSVVDTL
mmetsp:Transcript_26885/g.66265  ORF Transcript_26885/g.66265 Transcript_26885/m.66265 type:complete len:106 (-) Transcript_26885:24-341(-)